MICVGGLSGWAAEATSPVDATERNPTYAPTATVMPDKQTPASNPNTRVQNRRFQTTTVERQTSPMEGQRAAIEMREARDKNVWEKDSHRPEPTEQPMSAFNHKLTTISTGNNTTKPPTVTKYQESLTAASASNMARFPAFDRATSARINRFVFRKNPTEAEGAQEGAAVTPAAGGAAVRK